jgi:hypothetical protein
MLVITIAEGRRSLTSNFIRSFGKYGLILKTDDTET